MIRRRRRSNVNILWYKFTLCNLGFWLFDISWSLWVPYFQERSSTDTGSVLGSRTSGGQWKAAWAPALRKVELSDPKKAHIGVQKDRVPVSPTLTQCTISQRIIPMNTQCPYFPHTHPSCSLCMCVCTQVSISVTSHSLIYLAWDHNRDLSHSPSMYELIISIVICS